MSALIMIMVLTLVTVIIVEVGNRVRLPWPALMVLVGLAIAWVPGSHLGLPSNLVLPLLLPPLLYTAAERTSWQMFRRKWRSIVYFAMGLTLVT
ncbi:MAG: cation:proton antiporter, partial [Brooklawnia sp.]